MTAYNFHKDNYSSRSKQLQKAYFPLKTKINPIYVMSYPFCLKKNARIWIENLPVFLLLLDFCRWRVLSWLLCAPPKGLHRFSGDHSLEHLLCRCFLLLRDQLLGDGSLFIVIDHGLFLWKENFVILPLQLSVSAAKQPEMHLPRAD